MMIGFALTVYLGNINFHLFLYHALYFYPCTCMLYVIHALLAHLHCLILAPSLFHSLTTVAMHCLSTYVSIQLLNTWDQIFQGGLNISYSVLKYSVRGDKNFHDMPPDSPTLACLHAYAYIQIKHPRNPPSKNPGYGPATV